MGGIAAIIGCEMGYSRDLIEKMCEAIKHRGPDYSCTFLGSKIALGEVGFCGSSLDFSNQQLSNKEGNLWIAFDGYLGDSEERKLGRKDKTSPTSDAKAILECLRKTR